ncbi:hypothetical protein Tco_0174839 [Tanacetum coccineum]
MEDLKQHYLDEMLSLSNQIQIKDYKNKKIDIHFGRECEITIDELKGKFNGISIEINKKKELQQESTIPLNKIESQIPPSIAITLVLPTLEHEDSLNAIPDSIQSLLNRANSIIFLIEEFAGELAPINPIPPGIVEADQEKDIRLIDKLLNDDSSRHSPEELNSKIPDAIIEYFSPSSIPVEDNDSLMEEINIFLTSGDSIPPSIENDDYDSEGDNLFL